MKNILLIAFILLNIVTKAQNSHGIMVNFIPMNCKAEIQTSFHSLDSSFEGASSFDQKSKKIQLYLTPNDVFSVKFESGNSIRYFIIDTRAVDTDVSIDVPIDFTIRYLTLSLTYDKEKDSFYSR
jgi:hypothetical protein